MCSFIRLSAIPLISRREQTLQTQNIVQDTGRLLVVVSLAVTGVANSGRTHRHLCRRTRIDRGVDFGTRGLTEDSVCRIGSLHYPLMLAHTQGNQIRAAALLGINRNTLRKKIGELGVRVPGRAGQ